MAGVVRLSVQLNQQLLFHLFQLGELRTGIMNLSLSTYEALKAKRCAWAELGAQAGI